MEVIMNNIYFDNAATSFPKAPGVSTTVCNFIDNIGTNVGRGAYRNSYDAAAVIYETRELLCQLFNFNNPLNVVFTMNITQSLNILLRGFLKPGDHVIVSSMEHNAVMRPLINLTKYGIEFDRVQCDKLGQLNVNDAKNLIKSNTKLMLMTHASNVSGTLLPIKELGELCSENGIYFILDSAQTAGSISIDFKELNLSALAFTGHKGLLGPQGIGGFLISDELARLVDPIIMGGTGSDSESEYQPIFLPDKFEAGTLNLPGIFGLNTALKYINSLGIEKIHKQEILLTNHFLKGIPSLTNIEQIGLGDTLSRTSVVSINIKGRDNSDVAFLLDGDYNIMTRVGLHCSPSAHKTLHTYPKGTIRFSFGYFNTIEEIEYCINVLKKI